MDPELKAYLDELRSTVESLRAELRAGDAETRRHLDVSHEEQGRRISLLAEGFLMLREHIDLRLAAGTPSSDGAHRTERASGDGGPMVKSPREQA